MDGVVDDRPAAELADVAVVDRDAVEIECHVDVGVRAVTVQDEDLAGHPQVQHHEGRLGAAAEGQDEVLTVAGDRDQGAADHGGAYRPGRGLEHAGETDAYRGARAALQRATQGACDVLDLRKFRQP
jgi:hypothetical protein